MNEVGSSEAPRDEASNKAVCCNWHKYSVSLYLETTTLILTSSQQSYTFWLIDEGSIIERETWFVYCGVSYYQMQMQWRLQNKQTIVWTISPIFSSWSLGVMVLVLVMLYLCRLLRLQYYELLSSDLTVLAEIFDYLIQKRNKLEIDFRWSWAGPWAKVSFVGIV